MSLAFFEKQRAMFACCPRDARVSSSDRDFAGTLFESTKERERKESAIRLQRLHGFRRNGRADVGRTRRLRRQTYRQHTHRQTEGRNQAHRFRIAAMRPTRRRHRTSGPSRERFRTWPSELLKMGEPSRERSLQLRRRLAEILSGKTSSIPRTWHRPSGACSSTADPSKRLAPTCLSARRGFSEKDWPRPPRSVRRRGRVRPGAAPIPRGFPGGKRG